MNRRSWSARASLKFVAFPIHKDVIGYTYPIGAFQCRCQPRVKLVWRTSNTNGRPSNLYLPYDVCMIVILENSSSRGRWRKPLTSTRGKHFAELSL